MSSEITTQNLVPKLIEAVPEIKPEATAEWESRDDNWLVFVHVFYPHIVALLKAERADEPQLRRIFGFLELLLGQQNLEARDVAEDAICENICSDEAVLQKAQKYMGASAKKYCATYIGRGARPS